MPLPTHSFISQAILAREVNKDNIKILFTGDGVMNYLEVMNFIKL